MATQATTRARADEAKLKEMARKLLQAAYHKALDPNEQGAVQLGAMKLFLSKTMPDLKALEMKAEIDHEHRLIEVKFVDPDQHT